MSHRTSIGAPRGARELRKRGGRASRPPRPHPELNWAGWGDPARAQSLSPDLLALLGPALGVRGPGPQAGAIGDLAPGPSRLGATQRTELAAVVGSGSVLVDAAARVRHTRGRSTPDLLRLRLGDVGDAPDAVVLPGSHEQVLAVLTVCGRHGVAVVPYGGGTSTVGGLTPTRTGFTAVIALDLRRMDRLLELDEISRTATLEPGLRGPQAEALLGARGFTIGHHPQSFEFATIGGFAAARSSGQASAGYGRFDERVVGLRVAAPAGTLELGRAPRSAAGPDLRQLMLGSEGALGVITAVTVQISPVPVRTAYEGWSFPSFAEGTTALRGLAQDGPRPTVLRLSDEAETAINLAQPAEIGAGGPSGCLAIVGYEGGEADVRARQAGVGEALLAAGGEPQPGAGDAWALGRYEAPYLRDALLDAGALVETLETTTFWSGIPQLYEAVGTALRESLSAQGTPPIVLCHVSHVYATGASLYFTVAAAQLADPLSQWWAAKAAASDAILQAGGSISHHHGVGVDHREWYEREVGQLGVEALRAVKVVLDPEGILNPGVLIA